MMAIAFTPYSFGTIKPSVIAQLKAGAPLSILSAPTSVPAVKPAPAPVAAVPRTFTETVLSALGSPPRPAIAVAPPPPVHLMPMLAPGLVPTPNAPAPSLPTVPAPSSTSTFVAPSSPAIEARPQPPIGGGCGASRGCDLEQPRANLSESVATPQLQFTSPTLSAALALESARVPALVPIAANTPVPRDAGIPGRPFLEPIELAVVLLSLLMILAALVANRTKGVGVSSAFGRFIPEV
jgi:hypothetical protein